VQREDTLHALALDDAADGERLAHAVPAAADHGAAEDLHALLLAFQDALVDVHLVAYDTHLTSGCGGTPKVCQPVADLPITGQSDAQPFITAVWSGRVYVQVTNGLVVFSLPGDVG